MYWEIITIIIKDEKWDVEQIRFCNWKDCDIFLLTTALLDYERNMLWKCAVKMLLACTVYWYLWYYICGDFKSLTWKGKTVGLWQDSHSAKCKIDSWVGVEWGWGGWGVVLLNCLTKWGEETVDSPMNELECSGLCPSVCFCMCINVRFCITSQVRFVCTSECSGAQAHVGPRCCNS